MMTATADVTRSDITEALAHHCDTLKRMPAHWVERRAGIHKLIDQLLDDLEAWDIEHGG